VVDNRAQPQPVHIGRRDAQRVEVLTGLKEGDLILSQGEQGREGVVRVIQDPPLEGGESGSKMGG
jgi:multidrug efflux pump subunit AcrA (membrane-fusion protein)